MKQGMKLGGRMLSIYMVGALLSLLLLGSIGADWAWFQVALNVVLLAGMGIMMFESGGYRGERASTTTATVEHMRDEGHVPEETLLKDCFSKKVALVCALTVALPLFTFAAVNLIAEPHYPPVVVRQENQTAEEMSAMTEEQRQLKLLLSRQEMAAANYYAVATRLVFMPFVGMYRFFDQNPTGLNWLFMLFSLLIPVPAAAGYLCGPAFREKKLEQMRKSEKRKRRKMKATSQRKPPKPEV